MSSGVALNKSFPLWCELEGKVPSRALIQRLVHEETLWDSIMDFFFFFSNSSLFGYFSCCVYLSRNVYFPLFHEPRDKNDTTFIIFSEITY